MPLLTVELADMTGAGWGRIASVLLRYFLEMRKLHSQICVENSGTRVEALDNFDAGMGDLKPGEIIYALTHGLNLNGRLPDSERFLSKVDIEKVEDFLDLLNPRQLELLDPKRATSANPLELREISRRCIRQLRVQERVLQAISFRWVARDLDERITLVAAETNQPPQQTVASPGRRLILTMTESDLTAIFSLAQNCESVYDRKERVIAREDRHRLIGKKYEGLASLLDPASKNDPVVVARLLYFVEGKAEHLRNPWEIDPKDHLAVSKRIVELLRAVADSLQFGLRDERVLKMLSDTGNSN